MAIFAKKKDGRRQNQGKGEGKAPDGAAGAAAPGPDEPGAVLTKSNVPASPTAAESEIRQAAATGPASGETAGAAVEPSAASDGSTVPTDGKPAASVAAAPAEAGPPAAAEAESLEPVEIEPIEPEVIEAPLEDAPPAFGIADAIRLMRSLPADPNIDLVVRVVRVTLGAVNVSVEDIMRDAEKKERTVRDTITLLEAEVAELEKRLLEKRATIAAHLADLRETATVRERLHQADKYTPHPPPLPPGATRVAPPRPREWDPFDADVPLKDS